MSANWTEDEIAAFVDGELSGEEARRVATLIEQDEGARAVADGLRRQTDLLRAAFDAPMTEIVPPAIDAALRRPPAPARMARRVDRRPARARSVWAMAAVAACAAFAVGLGAGSALLGARPQTGPARLAIGPAPDAALAALDAAPSGATVAGLTPLASFVTRDGHCREFETADGVASVGLACLSGEGGWRIVALSAVEDPAKTTATGFAPASGAAVDALMLVLDALGAGEALSPAEEAALIADDWR